ncbi:MAG: 2,3-bisphosphoglycerate-independent phosphoglycerate mutase [Candidatus Altiarchaeota archaeon]
MKMLLIVCDGMGDRPCKELGGKTPLEAAKTPNMDKLAAQGMNGLMDTISAGVRPGSDTSHLALFGYEPEKYYSGRGPFEAAGIGMELKPGDIAFRVNFGTVDNDMVVADRRAGRIDDVTELCKAVDGMEVDGIKFMVKAGTGYRAGLVMRGKDLSYCISDCDSHEAGAKVLKVEPLDDSPQAKKTADAMNRFLAKSHELLKDHPINQERKDAGLPEANFLLERGPGALGQVPSMKERFDVKAACVAGAGLYKGVAKVVGMDLYHPKGATGKKDTDVKAKVSKAMELLEGDYDYVFMHVKATDVFGHDGDAVGKKGFIEKIDEALAPLLGLTDTVVAITADHSTPCSIKNHSGDPVPLLIWGPDVRVDDVTEFGERPCGKGIIHRIQGITLMAELMSQTARSHIYGA